jgi:glycosyltransferase involved in cell wall biosynthesis
VIFTGFVPDGEMALHFKLADLFIMPSEKEGFGIVFIEAMFYGLPVIAGNKDGSLDALCNGELGTIIDPDKLPEIEAAIKKILNDPTKYKPNRDKLHYQFSYEWYKRKLQYCLQSLVIVPNLPEVMNQDGRRRIGLDNH